MLHRKTPITKSRRPVGQLAGEEHREERDQDDDAPGDGEQREHDEVRDGENETERDGEAIPVLELWYEVDANARIVTRIRWCRVEREGRVILVQERRVGIRSCRVPDDHDLEVRESGRKLAGEQDGEPRQDGDDLGHGC